MAVGYEPCAVEGVPVISSILRRLQDRRFRGRFLVRRNVMERLHDIRQKP
jgi:hypothetical protein